MSATTNSTSISVTMVNIAAQKATVEAQYKALIAGITTEIGADQQFIINGTPLSKTDLLARFQARLDAAQKTKADRMALATTVATERQLELDVATLRMGFKHYLQSRYGKNSPALQKFGFTQEKKAQRPVVNQAAGIAKNLATRAARGTVGKKAKLKIKGAPAPTAGAQPMHASAGDAPPTQPKATPNPTPGNTA